MKVTIHRVVHRRDDEPERPILGTPLSLTVTMGRWRKECEKDATETKTIMIEYSVDLNIRQLSREQLGNLARDIVYTMVDDVRWTEEFKVFHYRVSDLRVDYFPRLLAIGSEIHANWDWGNKWSLIGGLSPTEFHNLEKTLLNPEQLYNPEHYTLEELSNALRCAADLHASFIRGQLRGEMDWSEVKTIHANVLQTLSRTVEVSTIPTATLFTPPSVWRAEVATGGTTLGYEDWLHDKLSSGERNGS
jgi:hypothetical protein